MTYALLFLSGSYLTREDSVILLVLSFNVGTGLIATLALPWYWAPIPGDVWIGIVLIAALAFLGHFTFSAAFARADVSLLAPFEYIALVWSVAIGFVVFGDVPASAVWIGAAVIILAPVAAVMARERCPP